MELPWTLHCEVGHMADADPKEEDGGAGPYGPLKIRRSMTVYNIMVPDEP